MYIRIYVRNNGHRGRGGIRGIWTAIYHGRYGEGTRFELCKIRIPNIISCN